MEILLGLLIIAIGAFCQSSCYVPINKIKNWSWESYWMLPDRGFFAGLYCLLRLDRLEQKAKLYYGNYCCKTDFDLIRKIKAIVSN